MLSVLITVQIQQEHSSEMLQKHSAILSKLVLPVEVVQTLYTEGVISKETFDEVERSEGVLTDSLLRTLSSTVFEDPNKLRVFGSILLRSEDTVRKSGNFITCVHCNIFQFLSHIAISRILFFSQV